MPAIFPATIDVSTLNGQNGFAITGSIASWSVRNAGDVNKDGIDDLIIGAPSVNSYAGAAYVIFGGFGIGSSGTLSIASLNGTNGFSVTGFPIDAKGGFSVSSAGDVNKDNVTDLIIGAPYTDAGTVYVIFGDSGIGKSGTLNVASLNGTNGFNITGFPANVWGGYSVNCAGDINNDSIVDLIIGASNGGTVGATYVVFGGPGVGDSGMLNITRLNGTNGFMITSRAGASVSSAGDVNDDDITDLITGGFFPNSCYVVFGASGVGSSGVLDFASLNGVNGFAITEVRVESVSNAGDVNNDGIADLIIGTPAVNSFAGAAYTIFGGAGVGSSGTLSVTNLNGANGFNITGFPVGAQGGFSVSSAGDINQDDVADFIIGAPRADSNAGTVYVVFGSPEISSSGMLDVRDLNGSNGFMITGFSSGTYYGWSVSSAGDINGDGVDDLIIGEYYIGPSYVIFGDNKPPVLLSNQLTIRRGGTQLLNATNLNATDTKHNPSAIQFVITHLHQGEFTLISNPSQAILTFTQLQVNAQQVQFKHNGSLNLAPSYNVSVYHSAGFAYVPPTSANVTYVPTPVLKNNSLTINQDQTVILTSSDLSAADVLDNLANLIFNISGVEHGRFTLVNNETISLTQFTQGNIYNGDIEFIQNGSSSAPSYRVTVIDSAGFADGPALANITFNSYPELLNNYLQIRQGETIILTSANLNAYDKETLSDNLVFTASSVQHGQFEDVSNPNVAIATFMQQKIIENSILFIQDGSSNKPFYNISVSDGVLSTTPMSVTVSFNTNPSQSTNNTNDNTIRNVAIGASISGVVLLGFFFGARYFSSRKAKQDLNDLLASDTTAIAKEQKLNRKTVTLIANKIFESMKTTNILSYRSANTTRDFLLTIEQIIWKLSDLMVNLNFEEMDSRDCGFLLNEIARQTRAHAISSTGCYTRMSHFFRAEITPQQLSNKVQEIAAAVKGSLEKSRPYLILEPGVTLQISRQSIVRAPKGSLEMGNMKLIYQ